MTDTPNPIDAPHPTESEAPKPSSEITHPLTNKKGWGGAVGSTLGRVVSVARTGLGSVAGAVGIRVGLVKKVVGGAVVGGISNATSRTGNAIDSVGSNFLVKKAVQIFKADWLLKILDQVDVNKSEAEVKRLKQKYPNESSAQIAQRIIKQKAFYAGASGFATSIVPGSAAVLFSVDLVTTTSLQAEMVYQIAGAYGMDLYDSTRKGEVIAIFGLAFGGKMAIKAGLKLLRNVPLAGAVIASTSEAVMLYTLGRASCAFYEAKLNPVNFKEKLEAIQKDSEQILKSAVPQEEIIDQILVHVILAGNQNRSKQSVLTDLRAANLRPESIDAIAEYMDSPIPLETLLTNIKPEFVLPLLVQCQKFAMLNGVVTLEEAEVIKMIEKKLGKV